MLNKMQMHFGEYIILWIGYYLHIYPSYLCIVRCQLYTKKCKIGKYDVCMQKIDNIQYVHPILDFSHFPKAIYFLWFLFIFVCIFE